MRQRKLRQLEEEVTLKYGVMELDDADTEALGFGGSLGVVEDSYLLSSFSLENRKVS